MNSPSKTIFLVERNSDLAPLLAKVIRLLMPDDADETVPHLPRLTQAVDVRASLILYSAPRSGIAEMVASAQEIRARMGPNSPTLILISGDSYHDELRMNNPFHATLIKPVQASTLHALLEAAGV